MTRASPVTLVCSGCGGAPSPDDPFPFRCPNAGRGDDVDHVLTVVVDPARVVFPDRDDPNPFIRYRELLFSYHVALAHGIGDTDYVDIVRRLDRAVARVDGKGFTVTPFHRSNSLSDHLGFANGGGVWVKDETGNVSGSHKARHLMGLLIYLEVVAQRGLAAEMPDLAIASCGNAALAAAVVARAGDRRLQVFVPTWADPKIVAQLQRLGARITVSPRTDGVRGDPSYLALQKAVQNGALPFTCQGPDNGLTIEGGKTLGYEMVSVLAQHGRYLDRLFVQVGGGALASATIQAFQDAVRLRALPVMPRIHAVQTAGGAPLKRAYDLVIQHISAHLRRDVAAALPSGTDDVQRAEMVKAEASPAVIEHALRHAARHRSRFMWPWEQEPKSIASGILDDETYDWLAVVRGMVTTGGYPVVVSEDTLQEANTVARRETHSNVDPTGSAGLAGLLHLHRQGGVAAEETVGVLFTGVKR